MKKEVRDSELSALTARSKRSQRLSTNAACSVCGAVDHLAIGPGGDVRCYAHLRTAAASVELDHWVGRATLPDAVIPLDPNAHRTITDLRRLIGFDDLPPADGDPLLLLAHLLEGMASLLVLMARWLVEHVSAVREGRTSPLFPVVA